MGTGVHILGVFVGLVGGGKAGCSSCFHGCVADMGVGIRVTVTTHSSGLPYDSSLAGAPPSTLGVLQRVQNAAARLIFELGPRDHVTDSLIRLHWLPIRLREQYKLVMHMYGIVVGTCPEYLQIIVEPAVRRYTQSFVRQRAPRRSSSYRIYAPSSVNFSGPVAWNSLPADIRCTTNRQTFKTLLKSHFFRQAFEFCSYC